MQLVVLLFGSLSITLTVARHDFSSSSTLPTDQENQLEVLNFVRPRPREQPTAKAAHPLIAAG